MDQQDTSVMEAPLSEEEVHNAIKNLADLKSQGPNSMSNEFFKKSANILKYALIKVFQEFFPK